MNLFVLFLFACDGLSYCTHFADSVRLDSLSGFVSLMLRFAFILFRPPRLLVALLLAVRWMRKLPPKLVSLFFLCAVFGCSVSVPVASAVLPVCGCLVSFVGSSFFVSGVFLCPVA